MLAYNIIGQADPLQPNIVSTIYRTLKEVFPQVYLFPAKTSMNVVLVATRSPETYDSNRVREAGAALVKDRVVALPGFQTRLLSFRSTPPPATTNSLVLTDDYAPVESLMRDAYSGQWNPAR